MEGKLGDLVEVPQVKLVVELDDAARDPEGILSSFVLTPEVREGLGVILGRIASGRGCGVFLKGSYGSGKSHFLSYLSLLLRRGELPPGLELPGPLPAGLRTASVSLVRYPAARSLEEIVLESLGHGGPVRDRQETVGSLVGEGAVVVVDELSEFLRSKPTPAAFHEDVRFLQFLGEFSMRRPLWVVASLQEWIEQTGHISSSMFNRIKDRYPVRVALTASHIEDVIDRRIVVKKPGAEAAIGEVFSALRLYYPHLPLKSEAFRKTYPLHPATVRMLAGLSPVFSQHRGVIQFVHARVTAALGGPPDLLVTPEAIFDHFEDRIREIPEHTRLAGTVFDYYRAHAAEIFPEERRREIALAAVKLMVLVEISPLEKRKTAREIAEMLLQKVSTLTAEVNYDFVRDAVLAPLAAHQMYVLRSGESFYIDPLVDEGLKLRATVKAQREALADRKILFREICARTEMPFLPLKDLVQGKVVKFAWQNTLRDCAVFVQQQERWGREEIERAAGALSTRLDGYLALLSPFSENRDQAGDLRGTVASPFLSALLFWIPRRPREDETAFLEEHVAKARLAADFPELAAELALEEARFREIVRDLYFAGEIRSGAGRVERSVGNVGLLPIEKLLGHFFDVSLSELHPSHASIMPRIEYASSYNAEQLFSAFIRPGKITLEEAEKKGLTPYVQGLLEPLGIVRRRGGAFHLALEPESELVSHVLTLVRGDESLAGVVTALRKGKWGMAAPQSTLLLSAFVVSGHLAAVREGIEVEVENFSHLTHGFVTGLRPGRVLSPELLACVPAGAFIWGEVEGSPTPLAQKAMWKRAVEEARRVGGLIGETQRLVERYGSYAVFRKAALDAALPARLGLFFDGIPSIGDPREGLERVLSYLRNNPGLGADIARLEAMHRFLSEEFQAVNRCHLYLTDPSLAVGGELEELQAAAAAKLDGYLRSPGSGFREAWDAWNEFFERYTEAYREEHGRYHGAAVFGLRAKAEQGEAFALLRSISTTVGSVAFDGDFWDVKSRLEQLPARCTRDLANELFQGPACGCGFRMGSEPPAVEADFEAACESGVRAFVRRLQSPPDREKLDAFLVGAAAAGREREAGGIASLLAMDAGSVGLQLVGQVLTRGCLEEIERALKGRWTVREIRIEDFVRAVKGRRLPPGKLREIFEAWAGGQADEILWVRGEGGSEAARALEALARYGPQGERLAGEASFWGGEPGLEEVDEKIEREGHLERIRWGGFPAERLVRFLAEEKLPSVRRRLRAEIFHRAAAGGPQVLPAGAVDDEPARDLLAAAALLAEGEKRTGAELFARVVAPLSLAFEKLRHGSGRTGAVDPGIVEGIGQRLAKMLGGLETAPGGAGGMLDAEALAGRLGEVLVVLDGLRYDLWCMLRGELEGRGWSVSEEPFAVPVPSTTLSFRSLLGIGEAPEGTFAGRSYTLVRWAEHGGGRRRLRNVLRGKSDLKILHFNFIDVKIHASSIDLYPLFTLARDEFRAAVLPLLEDIPAFCLASDHGFADTGRMKERYRHGGASPWEVILPFARVRRPF